MDNVESDYDEILVESDNENETENMNMVGGENVRRRWCDCA